MTKRNTLKGLLKKTMLVGLSVPSFMSAAFAQELAFPGAEGFGALASGGRNGAIYHVTTLSDSGPGSLRDAISQPNRTVVFDISGTIKTKSRMTASSNLTIAGETAPGEGISVYGHGISFSKQQNVIVRYLRLRGSIEMARGGCVLVADSAKNMIFDHLSVEWGRWDNLHIKHSSDITLQYCLIGESIDPQRFGALLEHPDRLTIHHSLWIDNQSRNPKAKAGIEFINNVVYNWGKSGFVGGHSAEHHHQDLINNYFIAGPSSSDNYLAMFTATDHVYNKGNFVDLNKDGLLNGKEIGDAEFNAEKATLENRTQNNPAVPVRVEPASDAYNTVLAEAGASLKRDALDARLAGYLKSLGKEGNIVWTETQAGGHPKLVSLKAEADTDADGLPDAYEKANKLDFQNAADASAKVRGSYYTRLEQYLHKLAAPASMQAKAK